jgi:hypothetical protein
VRRTPETGAARAETSPSTTSCAPERQDARLAERPTCALCGDPLSRRAAEEEGRRRCHRCEDRWLDFQCRALELHRISEEAIRLYRRAGGKLSHPQKRLVRDGLALLVAFFFKGAPGDGFGTAKIREVYPFYNDGYSLLFARLKHSGAVARRTPAEGPGADRATKTPQSSGWEITPAGERDLARFFLLLTRIEADPSVMLDSTHLENLHVRGGSLTDGGT